MKMKAFNGSLEVKQKYLDRLKAHYLADEIIKGSQMTTYHKIMRLVQLLARHDLPRVYL